MTRENNYFYQRRRTIPQRFLASFVILAFFFSQTMPTGFADISLRPEDHAVSYIPETDATVNSTESQTSTTSPVSDVQTTSNFLAGTTPISVGATQTTTQTVTPVPEAPAAKKSGASVDTQSDIFRAKYEALRREYASCLDDLSDPTAKKTAKDCEQYLGQLKDVGAALQDVSRVGATASKSNTTIMDQAMYDQLMAAMNASQANIDPTVGTPAPATQDIQYQQTEYSFHDAVDLLVPETAAAVIVESMTAQNLRDLTKLNVEVGIAVIRGKIVMFTTGSRDELRSNPVVSALLASESSILIHTHPEGAQITASDLDISLAGASTEYLLSNAGVVAYNHSGLVSTALTQEDLLSLIETVHTPDASSVEARSVLNEFIYNVDLYNSTEDRSHFTILRSANPVTFLPGRPALGVFNSQPPDSPLAPLPVISQSSTSEFSVNYNVSNPGSYAGAVINFDSTPGKSQDFSATGITVGLKTSVNNSNGSICATIEFKDDGLYKDQGAAFYVKGLTTAYQLKEYSADAFRKFYSDFDLHHVTQIVFTFDSAVVNSTGRLDVMTDGLYYVPKVDGVATGTATNLTGVGAPGALNPAGGVVTSVKQNSPDQFEFNYTSLAGQFGGAALILGKDTTVPMDGNLDTYYALPTGGLVFKVTGTNLGGKIRVSVSDSVVGQVVNGKNQYRSTTLEFDLTKGPYVVITATDLLSALPGFKTGELTTVSFVIDENVVPAGTSGKVTVDTMNLKYIPSVNPNLGSTTASTLPLFSDLIAFQSKAPDPTAIANVTALSANRFNLLFTVANEGSYGGTASVYTEAHDFTALSHLVLGLRLSAGSGDVFLELQDSTGAKGSVRLTGVNGTLGFYDVALTEFTNYSNVNLSKISNVNLVVTYDSMSASARTATTLEVTLANQPFVTNVPWDPTATINDISLLPQFKNLVAFGSKTPAPTGVATATPFTATRFNLNYNVLNGGSYVGSISTYDDFSTPAIESIPLSLTKLVLGLRLQSGGGAVKIIVEDASTPGNKAAVLLTDVTTTEKFYTIDKALFAGIDWSKVRNIIVQVESKDVSEKIGVLEVRFGNNYFIPGVITGTTYNPAALTSLPFFPALLAGSANSAAGEAKPTITMTPNSSSEFEYQYDLSHGLSGFTFVSIARTGSLVYRFPTNQYVFAAKGSAGERIQVEIKDPDNCGTAAGCDTAVYTIELTSDYQNFVLDLPANIDRTRIKEVVFVQTANLGSPLLNDFVKIQTTGLKTVVNPLPTDLQAIQTTLATRGIGYFDPNAIDSGIDPVTHFPYDNITDGVAKKQTQPTLIGFYLQILGDVVLKALNNGMDQAHALAEIQTVLTNLLSAQAQYGWAPPGQTVKGLIPWFDLGTTGITKASTDKVALGDNANLAQSLAVMVGALKNSGLTGTNLTTAQSIAAKVEQFLDNQRVGYEKFVDTSKGQFYGDVSTVTGVFSNHIDRLANEFRGAIAFLMVRYPTLPKKTSDGSSVWDNLEVVTNDSYVDRNGDTITNLAAWDGGAFQTFWPSLRNNEMDFIGFRNALYNQLVTQLDYAYQNRIPGILSASARPDNNAYEGDIGIPQIAEENMNHPAASNLLLADVGSTYALAAAMNVDNYAVLGWLDTIDFLYGVNGSFKFLVSDFIGTFDANSFKGNGLADGWDQGKLTPTPATPEAWRDALNQILPVRMRTTDYQSIQSNSTILAKLDAEAKGLLTKALISPAVDMTVSELEVLNRRIIEAVYPQLVEKAHSYGFYDSARSASEISSSYVGIDVASTVLGLSGKGGADFSAYLTDKGWTAAYNKLYDDKSHLLMGITRTDTTVPVAPEFPDRSFAVFSNLSSQGVINNFLPTTTQPYGIRLAYTDLKGVDSGYFWKFDQAYNATANQLIINYSAPVTPQSVRLEFKDAAGLVLYQTSIMLQDKATFARLMIDLPNLAILSQVKELDLVVDPQEGGAAQGDFTIHAIDFQHVPSAPVVPLSVVPSPAVVTVLPVNDATVPVAGVPEVVGTSPNDVVAHTPGTNITDLHFDLRQPNAIAAIVLNFDPNLKGNSIDLSAIPNLIFGISSAVAMNIQIEIEDTKGNTYRTSHSDIVASGYYKFLTSLAFGRVDLSHVKAIKFGVDQYSVTTPTEGDLQLEIGGLS